MWTPKRRAVPSSSMLDVEALERLGLLALSGAATNDAALATHRVLALRDGSHPVAYLVAATKRAVFLLPLREGVTLVGRGSGCEYEASRAELAGVVEGAQWKITCIATHALVQDTGSTNGSVLLGRDDRDAASTGLAALHAGSIGRRVGWDGVAQHVDAAPLERGDVLVNAYAAFVFVSREASDR